jgi:hypothetical protein
MQTASKKTRARPAATKDITPQSGRFKAMARELGADQSPEAFDRVLKRIAPRGPAPVKKKRARTK